MTKRVVHLGLGNFHRAHQAVYTGEADDGWTITGVARRSRRVVTALREQGMRYTVVTVDNADVRVDPVEVITEALVAADEPEPVLARLADEDTHVVTLTITEAGYTADGALIDLLRKGIERRGGAPLTVVSCDNLAGNGDVLRGLLPEYDSVAFPCTMVDRIVPATGERHIALAKEAGYTDAVPVPAEPFRQWVIQPHFAAERPSWDAEFTEDVAAWETVKVRLLNGTHSLIAYLGLLRGHEVVADAIADDTIRAAVDSVGDEYAATLDVPPGLDLGTYRKDLLHRFGNRALGHRTEQVGSDGSLKLVQRIPDAARWHVDRGAMPHALALTVAAFLQCWCRDVPLAGTPRDPRADDLRVLGAKHSDDRDLAHAATDAVFGDRLPNAFVERVGEMLRILTTHGTDAAVTQARP